MNYLVFWALLLQCDYVLLQVFTYYKGTRTLLVIPFFSNIINVVVDISIANMKYDYLYHILVIFILISFILTVIS